MDLQGSYSETTVKSISKREISSNGTQRSVLFTVPSSFVTFFFGRPTKPQI